MCEWVYQSGVGLSPGGCIDEGWRGHQWRSISQSRSYSQVLAG